MEEDDSLMCTEECISTDENRSTDEEDDFRLRFRVSLDVINILTDVIICEEFEPEESTLAILQKMSLRDVCFDIFNQQDRSMIHHVITEKAIRSGELRCSLGEEDRFYAVPSNELGLPMSSIIRLFRGRYPDQIEIKVNAILTISPKMSTVGLFYILGLLVVCTFVAWMVYVFLSKILCGMLY